MQSRIWKYGLAVAALFSSFLPATAEARRGTRPSTPSAGPACATAPTLVSGTAVKGDTTGLEDRFHAACAEGSSSPDAVYRLDITTPSQVVVTLETGVEFDGALYLRSACQTEGTDLDCNDDWNDSQHSQVTARLTPGTYYVIVDGYDKENNGAYQLTATVSPDNGTANPVTTTPPNTGSTNPPNTGSTTTTRTPDPTESTNITVVTGNQTYNANAVTPQATSDASQLWSGDAVVPGDGTARTVHGMVVFSKRPFTPNGVSNNPVDRAATHFVVEALNSAGQIIVRGETDDSGNYTLPVDPGSDVIVRAVSRTTWLGNDVRVVDTPQANQTYEVRSVSVHTRGNDTINLRAQLGGEEPAGAFNILSQFMRALGPVQRTFGGALPPLNAYWKRGNNDNLPSGSITAFLGKDDAHPERYALQVMGGDAGKEDESDSDQFDDPVILHELTHFIIDTQSMRFSPGGNHGGGELHMQGLALNEAVASVVAGALLGDGRYWDSQGIAPDGRVSINEDQESMRESVRGVGSEATNQMVQWDLVDGAEGIPDRDNDGVAIGLSGLFKIYKSFKEDPAVFPDIIAVLNRGVEMGMFTAQQAAALSANPERQNFSLPPTRRDQYPVELTVGGRAVPGKIDGRSNPAPSGGDNSPWNGFDAVKIYRLRLNAPRRVTIRLRISGRGTQRSGTDLDLQVTDRNMEAVASSEGAGPLETVSFNATAGTYIIWVRDGDQSSQLMHEGTSGNRASFTLQVR